MDHSYSRPRALVELLFAAMIWGFGFIAVRTALEGFSPLWLQASRFLLAVVISLPLLLRVPKLKKEWTPQSLKTALVPGLTLGTAILMQTFGLGMTTVMKSSFITSLYILIVPCLESFGLKRKLPWTHWGWVALALVGTGLICTDGKWELSFNLGDALTFGCAFLSAIHILQVEKFGKSLGSPFVFNWSQAFWSGSVGLLFAIFIDGPPPIPTSTSWMGVWYLAIFSTLIAFLIQVRSQRVIPASTVSLLFLLESPFATVFAYLILKEPVGTSQWLGALLILVASAGAVWRYSPAGTRSSTARIPSG